MNYNDTEMDLVRGGSYVVSSVTKLGCHDLSGMPDALLGTTAAPAAFEDANMTMVMVAVVAIRKTTKRVTDNIWQQFEDAMVRPCFARFVDE